MDRRVKIRYSGSPSHGLSWWDRGGQPVERARCAFDANFRQLNPLKPSAFMVRAPAMDLPRAGYQKKISIGLHTTGNRKRAFMVYIWFNRVSAAVERGEASPALYGRGGRPDESGNQAAVR